MVTLKPTIQFPFLSPPSHVLPRHSQNPTEIRLSRWNNANADKFTEPQRTQKQLEDQLRFQKRFNSADKITHNYNPAPPYLTTTPKKSTGTPSTPSNPSIPAKKSKYSKPTHPAFTPLTKTRRITPNPQTQTPIFNIDDNGVSYQLPDAPFLYQYSYTETPKMKPVKLREPLVSPFGPETMKKPWLGRKPLPSSKKTLPQFDSFILPPSNKKGVKPVQAPGPYLPGSGPKYVMDRDAVLGEPLNKEEVEELIKGARKSSRQLNMGRDGLTHNMLDNIHALWKRRRVCKIRCLGVCTVDMDNVCRQLEDKSGGKIIHRQGGVVYLFRGRNYNFNSRPRYPLMLWKPVSPVYPRLVKRAPEGLTVDEANEMRRKGRELTPICKIGKNGVYCDLVKNIREAFEACELVRINCQGMNPSDYRKIGAKLKDLVPSVLISFEFEHILIWRGREWKSSLPDFKESPKLLQEKVEGDDLALTQSDSLSLVPRLSESSSNNVEVSSALTYGNGELTGPGDENEIDSEKISLVIPEQDDKVISTKENDELVKSNSDAAWCEGVLLLRKEAVENGMAIVLGDDSLDADIVLTKVAAFSKIARAGPVFRHMRKKQLAVEKIEEEKGESSELKIEEAKGDLRMAFTDSGKGAERKPSREKKLRDIKVEFSNVVPEGDLRVDELAKLLA